MNIRMIYLAAGNGRRFRESIQDNTVNKLLYSLEEKPLWRHLYDRLEQILIRHPQWELVVVTRSEEIRKSVRKSSADKKIENRTIAVDSKDSEKGISYSIKRGITEKGFCKDEVEAYAFFVADQPYLSEKEAEQFLETMEKHGAKLGSVVSKGIPGNPTWFCKEYKEELMALEGDRGGRKILNAHEDQIQLYEIQNGAELRDIDIFGN